MKQSNKIKAKINSQTYNQINANDNFVPYMDRLEKYRRHASAMFGIDQTKVTLEQCAFAEMDMFFSGLTKDKPTAESGEPVLSIISRLQSRIGVPVGGYA